MQEEQDTALGVVQASGPLDEATVFIETKAYGGKLIELSQTLSRLESEVTYLDQQVMRSIQL